MTAEAITPGIVALPAGLSDPILPLYEEWADAREVWAYQSEQPGNEEWDSPEMLNAQRRETAAFRAMVDMTPVSLSGIAALTHVLWTIEGPAPMPGTEAYEKALTNQSNKLMLAIWRSASGTCGRDPDHPRGGGVSADLQALADHYAEAAALGSELHDEANANDDNPLTLARAYAYQDEAARLAYQLARTPAKSLADCLLKTATISGQRHISYPGADAVIAAEARQLLGRALL